MAVGSEKTGDDPAFSRELGHERIAVTAVYLGS
jgi:hypothetical protein